MLAIDLEDSLKGAFLLGASFMKPRAVRLGSSRSTWISLTDGPQTLERTFASSVSVHFWEMRRWILPTWKRVRESSSWISERPDLVAVKSLFA